ncbi:MAG: hypothetical protein HQK49_02180 [Oligoflexia bacterium]|nr:hypothetical protein [Oligoflexia bacterium]
MNQNQAQNQNLKIALIGNGKTGSKVQEMILSEPGKYSLIGPFNSRNRVEDNLHLLADADVIIVFVPGSAVDGLIPHLMKLKKIVIWGSTGYKWEEKVSTLNESLINAGVVWIYAYNFSLMMNMIKELMTVSKKFLPLFDVSISIKEIHHIHKKDAPSGTALMWRDWLLQENTNIKIESVREGDVVGIHELTIESENERIQIIHQSKDRKLFAEGALWCALFATKSKLNKNCNAGLLSFNQFVLQILK